jgi:hypothetical protein
MLYVEAPGSVQSGGTTLEVGKQQQGVYMGSWATTHS